MVEREVVGIDVSKAKLDVAVVPSGEQFTVSNDRHGIGELLQRLSPLAPGRVVLEATGRADPEVLAVHYQGAGNLERAGQCSALAADRAAEALAFDRAARLYRTALELGGLPDAAPEQRRLRERLADALPIEHEEEHRRLAGKVVEGGLNSGKVDVSRPVEEPAAPTPAGEQPVAEPTKQRG